VTVPLQRRRKEGHPIPASRFCFQEIFMIVPALTNEPDFRHSGVASGDLADITPTQPSPIKGEGFRMALWEFELRVPRAVFVTAL
jgi:hypothetical protein